MSTRALYVRLCPTCQSLNPGYSSPTPNDWRCSTCRTQQIRRGRHIVESWCWAMGYDDPEDRYEHEQAAVDVIADILHYIRYIQTVDQVEDLCTTAHRTYTAAIAAYNEGVTA